MGLKIKVEITHPEWILFGDEVGSTISQKDYGHVAGKKVVTPKNTRANMKTSHKDGKIILIGLTAMSVDHVMVIIIFAAEELSFEQMMGHDILVLYVESKSVEDNSGEGKTFPGGPTCIFREKETPALVTCSSKVSITSEILRATFEKLDNIGVYEREENRKPFCLFDTHDSRLQVSFLI